MDLATIAGLISSIGFPIVCALVMGWFIYQIFKKTTEQNETNMAQVQARCKEREDKLYAELEKSREINGKAIETIAHYAEKLDHIQQDINEIKSDIIILTTRAE
jgi:cell division protein YceG involved in septum cleavage